MRCAPPIATRFVSFETGSELPKKRRSIFRIIFEALHHSRRLKADRTLYRYRHLIQKAESSILRELNKRSEAKGPIDGREMVSPPQRSAMTPRRRSLQQS